MNSNTLQHQINLNPLSQIHNQLDEVFEQLINAYSHAAQLEQQQHADLQRHTHSIKYSWQNTANFSW